MGLVKMQATDAARPPVRTSNAKLLILGLLALPIPPPAALLPPPEAFCASGMAEDAVEGDIFDDICNFPSDFLRFSSSKNRSSSPPSWSPSQFSPT